MYYNKIGNYIDTAAGYRNSEEIIGASISHRRNEYFLATKTNKRDYASAKEEIERSLVRMQTDQVDLLQIHYVNYLEEFKEVMAEGGAYEAVLEAQLEGRSDLSELRDIVQSCWLSG